MKTSCFNAAIVCFILCFSTSSVANLITQSWTIQITDDPNNIFDINEEFSWSVTFNNSSSDPFHSWYHVGADGKAYTKDDYYSGSYDSVSYTHLTLPTKRIV